MRREAVYEMFVSSSFRKRSEKERETAGKLIVKEKKIREKASDKLKSVFKRWVPFNVGAT